MYKKEKMYIKRCGFSSDPNDSDLTMFEPREVHVQAESIEGIIIKLNYFNEWMSECVRMLCVISWTHTRAHVPWMHVMSSPITTTGPSPIQWCHIYICIHNYFYFITFSFSLLLFYVCLKKLYTAYKREN